MNKEEKTPTIKIVDVVKDLQPKVAQWSLENFGDQTYRNPLEGIGEEIGELFEALYTNSTEFTVAMADDAMADIMIFMMDFCSRYRINLGALLKEKWAVKSLYAQYYTLPINYGKLLCGIVKRDQGIRIDRWNMIYEGLVGIVKCLEINCGNGLSNVLLDTWDNIVSKRKAVPLEVRQ